jgi:dihydrofolate synthase/folylpolyglutamate synthase
VLASLPRRRSHLVLSISADKDTDAILSALLPQADEVTVTRAEPVRSLPPEAVAEAIHAASPGLALQVVPDPQAAVRAARAQLADGDLLCVTGSIFLAGIARGVLKRPDPSGGAAPPESDQRALLDEP